MSGSARQPDWIDVASAQARVLAAIEVLSSETVPLRDAVQRTLAAPVSSPIDQPPWNNSAMDGYATRAADVVNASKQMPTRLRVIESIAAGEFPRKTLGPGEATRIMTGAPVPEGADTVIRVEHTREGDADHVLIVDAMDAGRNLRFRGEDLRTGDTVLLPGRFLRPGEIGVLATVGASQVEVFRRPRVAILSTGNELAELNQFDQVLQGRKIVNSNSYSLAAATIGSGALPVMLGIASDDAASLRDHIEQGFDADVLVTTAGASVGDHDLVKDVLEELGCTLDFWRVRMRPGSPISFGLIPARDRRIPVFCLPGNPVSALVTFELFVRPALRKMQGRTDVYPATMRVKVEERTSSKRGLTHFLRATLKQNPGGEPLARLTGGQGSGLITSMAHADALLIVPEDRDALEAGELAWAVRLTGPDQGQENPGY
ncbi:MAG: gephyrin-like molybdotransferase Glp [Gemmatimonadota bacterium]